MTISITNVLDVLAAYDIHPVDDDPEDIDLPGIGNIEEGEGVYTTSIEQVLGREGELQSLDGAEPDDPHYWEWREAIDEIIARPDGPAARQVRRRVLDGPCPPLDPHCAWYCPIHFFGHGWGIYIRESCIFSHAIEIASFVDWRAVRMHKRQISQQLLRSAFYVFYLHEQFHHKVESLGFRLLVSSGSDRYRAYKRKVYRRTYLTPGCIEESLANAESYRRLNEKRYKERVDPAIRSGLRFYLKASFATQPDGYKQGLGYLTDAFQNGLQQLKSQVLDGAVPAVTPERHWTVAPNMITSLSDITEEIYVVLPKGRRPIFRSASVDPGMTVSSRALAGALTRHYGYAPVPGGKGSHCKLKKPGAPTIVLPGDRPVLSPGVVKHVLAAVGGHPISRLHDLLEGRLAR